MHLCPLLSDLSCSNCGINSHDLENLFLRLQEIKSPPLVNFVSWQLEGNKIDDDGISILVKYLPSIFPNLEGECVEVEHNLISKQMRQKLNDIMSNEVIPVGAV